VKQQHSPRSQPSSSVRRSSGPESYPQLLRLAARLTGTRRAAFFLLNRKSGTLTTVAGPDLPPLYRQAAWMVAKNGTPQLFYPPDKPTLDPMLAVPIKIRDQLLGVLLLGDRPQDPVTQEDLTLVTLLAENPSLIPKGLSHEKTTVNFLESIKALVRTLEARDHYTGKHCQRVTELALHFACYLGLPREDLKSLKAATFLHDLGKVGVSDTILLRPGSLSPGERFLIETHPVLGVNIVEPLNLKPKEKEIILHHHERWDGRGYPLGLAGEQIPFLCRLVALADVYDALTSDRPYRRRFTIPEALAEIQAQAGTQFDPDLTRKFLQMMADQTAAAAPVGRGPAARKRRPELRLSD
jgi:putative nucleotidyltransferase with HDIG domain